MVTCPKCGIQLPEGARFCSSCATPIAPSVSQAQGTQAYRQTPNTLIWYQNFYRIRKKIVAIVTQYWIEDQEGHPLGYTRQKLLRIKEDIRIYSDETMSTEIFRIKQENLVDTWGTFAIIDSATNSYVGILKRKAMSQIGKDEYLLLDPTGQPIGRVAESTGRGLARKYMPGGGLVPEHVAVEFYGQEVAEIKQRFKVIGDVWEVDCSRVPSQVDRRTLLASMLIMGMVEREQK